MLKDSWISRRMLSRKCTATLVFFFVAICLQTPSSAQEKKLTLADCQEIALANNLDIAQVKKIQEEAEFKLKQAKAGNYPEVGIAAAEGYISELNRIGFDSIKVYPEGMPPMTIPGREVSIGEHDRTDLSVLLTQPLYTGGIIQGGIRAAQAGLEGAAHQMALAKSLVRNQVTAAFYNLASAMEYRRIAVSSRDQIQSHLRDAENLLQQGMLLKSDLLPIDIRRLDTELMIVKAENDIARSRAALAERMGVSPDQNIDIEVDWNKEPPWPIPGELLTDPPARPEQQIALQRIEAADAEIDIASGALRPQVGLSVSGHYGWPGFYADEPEWQSWWQAGMNVSWNIFDMARRKNECNAAAAKKSRLFQEKASLDHQIALDRINTRLGYEEAYRKLLISKQKVVSARENFKTKEDNFRVGMATNTDYLDAHTELMNAESELAVISAQVQIAWSDFLRAVGEEDWPEKMDSAKEMTHED